MGTDSKENCMGRNIDDLYHSVLDELGGSYIEDRHRRIWLLDNIDNTETVGLQYRGNTRYSEHTGWSDSVYRPIQPYCWLILCGSLRSILNNSTILSVTCLEW